MSRPGSHITRRSFLAALTAVALTAAAKKPPKSSKGTYSNTYANTY